LAFATFLVLRLQIGACGVGAYASYPNEIQLIFFESQRLSLIQISSVTERILKAVNKLITNESRRDVNATPNKRPPSKQIFKRPGNKLYDENAISCKKCLAVISARFPVYKR